MSHKVIYIASPYTIGDINENIYIQLDAAEEITKYGGIPRIPLLFHYWNERHTHSWEFWMELCLKEIDLANALLRLGGQSKGADIEVEYALKRKIPIFFSIGEAEEWLKSQAEM